MSDIADRAERIASAGRREQAVLLLEDAARRGDGDALFTLAVWHLAGQHVARDLAGARRSFAQAARAGRTDALAIYIAFVANGTGGDADWREAMRLLDNLSESDERAREQRALVTAMELDAAGNPVAQPRAERLTRTPDVLLYPALFTPTECDYLARLAEPLLAPAAVVEPRSGRYVRDPVRLSDVAAFPLALENPAVHALNRRLAVASATDAAQGEPLQIISYRPGQEYRPHLDALTGADNQRILTMLVYLTDGYTGGETRFLPDGPLVRAGKGDAILFRNADDAGRPDPASLHAGLPVTAGRKVIASRWIRQRPLDLGDRPGRS